MIEKGSSEIVSYAAARLLVFRNTTPPTIIALKGALTDADYLCRVLCIEVNERNENMATVNEEPRKIDLVELFTSYEVLAV